MEGIVGMPKLLFRFKSVPNITRQIDIISLFQFFASELLSDAHITYISLFNFSQTHFDKQ